MRPSRPTSILVADDDGIMRDLMRDLLTQAGYQVRLAMSGDEALATWTRHGPAFSPASLALLDMDMPPGDGITTCRSLRRLPGWHSVPIVIVTSHSTDLVVRDALDAGINGFVVKPFSAPDLLHRIAGWTQGQGTPGVQGRPTPAARLPPRAMPPSQPAGAQPVPGIAWSIGDYSLPSHERGETRDVSRLLRGRAGTLPP